MLLVATLARRYCSMYLCLLLRPCQANVETFRQHETMAKCNLISGHAQAILTVTRSLTCSAHLPGGYRPCCVRDYTFAFALTLWRLQCRYWETGRLDVPGPLTWSACQPRNTASPFRPVSAWWTFLCIYIYMLCVYVKYACASPATGLAVPLELDERMVAEGEPCAQLTHWAICFTKEVSSLVVPARLLGGWLRQW